MKPPLHEALMSNIQDITTHDDERKKLRHELYQEGDRIKRQKNECFNEVLKDLRGGGWGKKSMEA